MTRHHDILGVPPDADELELKARWLALARVHHPDKGGDAATFDTYKKAYERCLELAQRPKLCPECGGRGKTSRPAGFIFLDVPCGACGGSGRSDSQGDRDGGGRGS